ncbi:class I SAM-dependent methyltransferase [Streptomyces chromofuscus]|uniref:Class I SAM-dependent methyltransferase n=1 Tax=Streptomyces chromofuscus TaxID=42881 RepID=A0A7M2T5J5_STRCW|nr:class I SAM-dependent methyltransferase [Streptomyces chromofuscus]QOV43936.1 class I SAM-dependent methyltransferase [Streptomyces chromofuscus]GGT07005.1 methyltransferase [Streptomyces chromofuscus]
MSVTSRYREAWEGFWREAPGEQGSVFWDAEPALTAGRHVALFEPHLTDPGLPMVDLGCGNGTQTRFLAGRFPRVLGVDLSAAAVDHAGQADPAGQAAYRVLDAADKTEAQALHAELGDANVYMRGVLHQCEPADRQPLVDGMATLAGGRGRVFLVELAEAAGLVLRGLAQSQDGPPAKLAPVFRHGIAPGEVADAAVPEFLTAAGLTVLASGDLPLTTTEYGPDGARIELPSKWLVAGRTG